MTYSFYAGESFFNWRLPLSLHAINDLLFLSVAFTPEIFGGCQTNRSVLREQWLEVSSPFMGSGGNLYYAANANSMVWLSQKRSFFDACLNNYHRFDFHKFLYALILHTILPRVWRSSTSHFMGYLHERVFLFFSEQIHNENKLCLEFQCTVTGWSVWEARFSVTLPSLRDLTSSSFCKWQLDFASWVDFHESVHRLQLCYSNHPAAISSILVDNNIKCYDLPANLLDHSRFIPSMVNANIVLLHRLHMNRQVDTGPIHSFSVNINGSHLGDRAWVQGPGNLNVRWFRPFPSNFMHLETWFEQYEFGDFKKKFWIPVKTRKIRKAFSWSNSGLWNDLTRSPWIKAASTHGNLLPRF